MSFVLKINDRFLNRRVRFFNKFSLNLQHDAVGSSFSFDCYFDPENAEHRELTTPLHYHECTVEFDDELLLTGFILNNNFKQSAAPTLVNYSGYSLPGVLEDCEIPTWLYPLQSNGLSLKQIAEKLANAFRLKVEIDESVMDKMNRSFDTSTASETSSVKGIFNQFSKAKKYNYFA